MEEDCYAVKVKWNSYLYSSCRWIRAGNLGDRGIGSCQWCFGTRVDTASWADTRLHLCGVKGEVWDSRNKTVWWLFFFFFKFLKFVWYICELTNTRAVSVGVPHGTALSGNARHPMRPGQDWPAKRRHQLWAESCPYSGTIGESLASLQPSAGAAVSKQHSTRRAQTPKAARNIAALVGTRVWGLQTLINVWKAEQGSSKSSLRLIAKKLSRCIKHNKNKMQSFANKLCLLSVYGLENDHV